MIKPKYKIGDCIYGRIDHIGYNLRGETWLIEVDGARWDSHYSHWIYIGFAQTIDKDSGENNVKVVEMYDHDVIGRVK